MSPCCGHDLETLELPTSHSQVSHRKWKHTQKPGRRKEFPALFLAVAWRPAQLISPVSCFLQSAAPCSAAHLFIIYLLSMARLAGTVDRRAETRQEIDLIQSLQLHNSTFSGIELQPGPHSSSPALLFTGEYRAVYYTSSVRDSFTSIIRSSKDVTFMTSVKQKRGNSGTLLALSFGGNHAFRYLEIQSSGRQDVLRLHYWPQGAKSHLNVRVESFPLQLADDSWHRLAVSLSGDQLEIFLDCTSIHRRVIPNLELELDLDPDTYGQDLDNLTLWLGQRNSREFLFKGYLQNTRVVSGQFGYLVQCPHMQSACPTCGQFRGLESEVERLIQTVNLLESRLRLAEDKISNLQECECSRSCKLAENEKVPDGHVWKDPEDHCLTCSCEGGSVSCIKEECGITNCAEPIPPMSGQCCPICPEPCPQMNLTHGEVIFKQNCEVKCTCNAGVPSCIRTDICPPLNCPDERQFREEGQCCPVCTDVDWCIEGKHECHENAECRSGMFRHSCHCKPGFKGNGTNCVDKDECSETHQCTGPFQICKNIPGSYICECKDGYREDFASSTCVPIDYCKDDLPVGHLAPKQCDTHAICTNRGPGLIDCACKSGYSGDGTSCTPICSGGCDNGGVCVAPETCDCPVGFTGSMCQEDVDECRLSSTSNDDMPETGVCGPEAECHNRPGWFYCSCRAGFRLYTNPVDGRHSCVDIDECSEGLATCLAPARCRNTPGAYTCECTDLANEQPADADLQPEPRVTGFPFVQPQRCPTGCLMAGQPDSLVVDGSQWLDNCNSCACIKGRISCRPVDCDSVCSNLTENNSNMPVVHGLNSCCANHCRRTGNLTSEVVERDDDLPAVHTDNQEEAAIRADSNNCDVFQRLHGERWMHHCNECECLYGEVDCWPLVCPRTEDGASCRLPSSVCCPADRSVGGSDSTTNQTADGGIECRIAAGNQLTKLRPPEYVEPVVSNHQLDVSRFIPSAGCQQFDGDDAAQLMIRSRTNPAEPSNGDGGNTFSGVNRSQSTESDGDIEIFPPSTVWPNNGEASLLDLVTNPAIHLNEVDNAIDEDPGDNAADADLITMNFSNDRQQTLIDNDDGINVAAFYENVSVPESAHDRVYPTAAATIYSVRRNQLRRSVRDRGNKRRKRKIAAGDRDGGALIAGGPARDKDELETIIRRLTKEQQRVVDDPAAADTFNGQNGPRNPRVTNSDPYHPKIHPIRHKDSIADS